MSSKAITPDQPDRPPERPGFGAPLPEVAPSNLRSDDQSLPRTFGMSGAVLVLASTLALGFHLFGRNTTAFSINPGWAVLLLVVGLGAMLYHAAFDRDVMFRRLYQTFAVVLLMAGVFLALLPYPKAMGDQLRLGAPCLLLALMFAIAGLRNETDDPVRQMMEVIFGAAGALMSLVGLFGGMLRNEFLIPLGLVFAVIGLFYLAAFVINRGVSDDLAYYAAIALVVAGLLTIVIPIGRGLFGSGGGSYFTGFGTVLVVVGLAYLFTGGSLASDLPLLVLFRRELGAMFYSPITYLLLIAFSFVWFGNALVFFQRLLPDAEDAGGSTLVEPIVASYMINFFPILTGIIAVPMLTMGSFSEEYRSGTIEVLLTAPVSDTQVLLSKFFAALVAYLITWLPAGLYLLALLMAGAAPFDHRPLLSFALVQCVWGAAFIAMGLFFSSVTRHMLIAAVLSFAGMLGFTLLLWLAYSSRREPWGPPLAYISYYDAWESALKGKIVPRFLLFPASVMVLFLFLTHKVLDSRKWR